MGICANYGKFASNRVDYYVFSAQHLHLLTGSSVKIGDRRKQNRLYTGKVRH